MAIIRAAHPIERNTFEAAFASSLAPATRANRSCLPASTSSTSCHSTTDSKVRSRPQLHSAVMSIQEGDLVIIYSSRQQIDSVIVKSGTEFQSRYGHFKHADMIGVAFGSKVSCLTPPKQMYRMWS